MILYKTRLLDKYRTEKSNALLVIV